MTESINLLIPQAKWVDAICSFVGSFHSMPIINGIQPALVRRKDIRQQRRIAKQQGGESVSVGGKNEQKLVRVTAVFATCIFYDQCMPVHNMCGACFSSALIRKLARPGRDAEQVVSTKSQTQM